MTFPRSAGILLHPISLPSHGGIGDFGPAAYEFLDFLAEARQGVWQVLPLNPPANGNSPYSSTSAFAGNPQLVSLERLVKYGWLDAASVSALPTEVARIDYEQVNRDKLPLLWQAARNFLDRANGDARQRFDGFCGGNSWWLEDYVLFDTLRERHGRNWSQWPAELARREAPAVAAARLQLGSELLLRRVAQFFFWEQWRGLRHHCAPQNLPLVGGGADFVHLRRGGVLADPRVFCL